MVNAMQRFSKLLNFIFSEDIQFSLNSDPMVLHLIATTSEFVNTYNLGQIQPFHLLFMSFTDNMLGDSTMFYLAPDRRNDLDEVVRNLVLAIIDNNQIGITASQSEFWLQHAEQNKMNFSNSSEDSAASNDEVIDFTKYKFSQNTKKILDQASDMAARKVNRMVTQMDILLALFTVDELCFQVVSRVLNKSKLELSTRLETLLEEYEELISE